VRTISPAPGKTLAEITIQERSPVLLSDDFLMIFICVRRSLARAPPNLDLPLLFFRTQQRPLIGSLF
jgi:hypothetical protein